MYPVKRSTTPLFFLAKFGTKRYNIITDCNTNYFKVKGGTFL